jgi:hypothetical protein
MEGALAGASRPHQHMADADARSKLGVPVWGEQFLRPLAHWCPLYHGGTIYLHASPKSHEAESTRPTGVMATPFRWDGTRSQPAQGQKEM